MRSGCAAIPSSPSRTAWPKTPAVRPSEMRPDSRAVHAGREVRAREPLAPPIVQASVYVFDDVEDYDAVASGRSPGHAYGRNSNENVASLEEAVAALEGAEDG